MYFAWADEQSITSIMPKITYHFMIEELLNALKYHYIS
jgi:hypothetical protein